MLTPKQYTWLRVVLFTVIASLSAGAATYESVHSLYKAVIAGVIAACYALMGRLAPSPGQAPPAQNAPETETK